jgi:hypothetical protein
VIAKAGSFPITARVSLSEWMECVMDMKKINAGKLRAIGYDPRQRILRVEFDDGSAIDYSNVGAAVWQKLSTSGSAWSYYRDNIEEEFSGRRGRVAPKGKSGALEDLFKAPGGDEGT